MRMKKPYGNKNSCRLITSAIVCLLSNNIIADCDSTADMHYPSVNPPNYQGSAHTDSFDCAVNGTKQLTFEQINERAGLVPPRLTDRFYFRMGANAAAQGITSVSNQEPNNLTTNQTGIIQNTNNKQASNNFEMAFGYVWSAFAIDVEWLSSSSISYESEIFGVSPTFTINSTVKGDALLLNLYWIFNDMYNVQLYGDFIIGYSDNTSTSYLNSDSPADTKWKHWAFGAGFGGRFNIVSRLYADVKGRYIFLGTTRLVATDGVSNAYLKANRTWLGASVCLLWLF